MSESKKVENGNKEFQNNHQHGEVEKRVGLSANNRYVDNATANEGMSDTNSQSIENSIDPVERPVLLMEYLPHDPYCVLNSVFSTTNHFDRFKDRLWQWLDAFNYQEVSEDESNLEQDALRRFYDALFLMIEALHGMKEEKNSVVPAILPKRDDEIQLHVIDPLSPAAIVRNFCRQYRLQFVRRELCCFVNAVMSHGFYFAREEFSPEAVLEWQEEMGALAETAYVLNGEGGI